MTLPEPHPDAAALSRSLSELIMREAQASGWISFARYMELALYAPGLGYYAAPLHKFGAAGDFVTAPELGPLFARTLAVQVEELMSLSAAHIVEAGAGSGALAVELLRALAARGTLPERYHILELSGDLRQRQHAYIAQALPELAGRVRWLEAMPERFDGVVLANEVLDAMPVHLLHWSAQGLRERGLAPGADATLVWAEREPGHPALIDAVRGLDLPTGYLSEVNLAATAWVSDWARRLGRGALLLIDYGFARAEYYHAQRVGGTLMCHYQHQAHTDPLWWPGLCDITAHVDFTAVAEAGFDAGLSVEGYTSQAAFLLNCGVLEAVGSPPDAIERTRLNAVLNQLTSPAEMGELFKVICLGRGLSSPLCGFTRGDRTHTL